MENRVVFILFSPCMTYCPGRALVLEEGASGGDAPGRNAGAFVQALLDLRDTYNRFLVESFSSDQQFKNAIASVSTVHHVLNLRVERAYVQ